MVPAMAPSVFWTMSESVRRSICARPMDPAAKSSAAPRATRLEKSFMEFLSGFGCQTSCCQGGARSIPATAPCQGRRGASKRQKDGSAPAAGPAILLGKPPQAPALAPRGAQARVFALLPEPGRPPLGRGERPESGGSPMQTLESFVAGRWQAGSGPATAIENPTNEERIAETSSAGIDFGAVLAHAHEVGGPALRALSFGQRGELLMALSKALHERREELIEVSIENGGST